MQLQVTHIEGKGEDGGSGRPPELGDFVTTLFLKTIIFEHRYIDARTYEISHGRWNRNVKPKRQSLKRLGLTVQFTMLSYSQARILKLDTSRLFVTSAA